MAKFLHNGSGHESGPRDKTPGKTTGKAAVKAAAPLGEPATTVRFIRLAKPANDNLAPLGVRLRRWGTLALVIGATLALWHFS
ncbi:MAG: hypothetical protein ACK4NA_04875 [Alphaproteobacteria bacterium]